MTRLPGPLMTTARVVLQTPRLRDVPNIYRWTRDPAITRYMSWLGPESPKDTLEFVQRARAEQRRGEALHYVLHDRDTGRSIGCCGTHHLDRAVHGTAEVGYWLARRRWGQGLMGEVLPVFLAYLFSRLELHRLHAQVFVKNARSARLLERLGFQFEGTLRRSVRRQGRAFDVHQYALLRTDRAARRMVRRAQE